MIVPPTWKFFITIIPFIILILIQFLFQILCELFGALSIYTEQIINKLLTWRYKK